MGNHRSKFAGSRWHSVLALTGGMGSGKSTVLQMLKEKGAFVLDADQIVHVALKYDKSVLRKIRQKFGADVFDEVGNLNRRKLGAKVFASDRAISFLEKLLHPLVRQKMAKELRKNSGDIAVCDIPLLFETRRQKQYDGVIVVNSAAALRRRRLLKKGFTAADITKRFRLQMPLSKKVKQADFVVNNNGTVQQTQKQINQLWLSLIRSKS